MLKIRCQVVRTLGLRLPYGATILLASLIGCDRNPIPTVVNSRVDPCRIEIIGHAKRWAAVYYSAPDPPLPVVQRLLVGSELHFPADTQITLDFKSRDFVYTFAIPARKLKELAVPKLSFQLPFRTGKASELTIVSEPMCGDPHSEVAGRIVIESPEKFRSWVDSLPPVPAEWRDF